MPETFTYNFETPVYKGQTTFSTGLFIDGKFVDGVNKGTIECVFSFLTNLVNELTVLSAVLSTPPTDSS